MDKATYLSEYLQRRYGKLWPANLNAPIFWWHFYKTLTHRDLHVSNIFYSDTPTVYLIDNNTMAYSRERPTTIIVDIVLAYLYVYIYMGNVYGLCLRNAGLKESELESRIHGLDAWEKCRDIFDRFAVFYKSYIGEFPTSEQRVLAKYLALLLESDLNVYLHSSNSDEKDPSSYGVMPVAGI